jgi:hypothetical protein
MKHISYITVLFLYNRTAPHEQSAQHAGRNT